MPTSRLQLPFIAAAQAQKHVTINQAFLRLDATVQMVIASRNLVVQPSAPADGDLYILPSGKTGSAWGAMTNYALAYYRDGVWEELTPREGWIAFVRDEDQAVYYTGAAWAGLAQALAKPAGHLYGLTLSNNGSDPSNDIDIAAGVARDGADTADLVLAAALTKRLDASWAVGTNQGGLDTGAKANSTWYHLWLITRPDTGVVDALFSTSATAPTMPSNYTKKRRIGAVRTDGSGNIRAFTQTGDEFLFTTPVKDIDIATLGASSTAYALTAPPRTEAICSFFCGLAGSGPQAIYLRPTGETDTAPNVGGYDTAAWVGSTDCAAGHARVRTDASSQIAARSTVASTTLALTTRGWVDNRGKEP